MKFHEAVSKMKVGDIFTPITTHTPVKLCESGFFQATAHNLKTTFSQEYMLLEGVITSAEPKVLSAEEWRAKQNREFWNVETLGNIGEKGFNDGHQNGRLEMYLEFKKYWGDWDQQESTFLKKAIEYLKPLNEP
jgi:hypothetical protein